VVVKGGHGADGSWDSSASWTSHVDGGGLVRQRLVAEGPDTFGGGLQGRVAAMRQLHKPHDCVAAIIQGGKALAKQLD